MERPEKFVRTFTAKMLMYALARELQYFDMPQVRAIVDKAESNDYRLYDLDKLKCWPAGTGYALADWLRTRGHEPVFFTEEENAERRRGLGLPSKD